MLPVVDCLALYVTGAFVRVLLAALAEGAFSVHDAVRPFRALFGGRLCTRQRLAPERHSTLSRLAVNHIGRVRVKVSCGGVGEWRWGSDGGLVRRGRISHVN